MKRSLVLAAVVCMVATASVGSAQAAKTVSIGVSGGLSMPMGDLGDAAESGYNVTGHFYYKGANRKRLLFRGDVGYDAWSGKSTAAGTSVEASLSSLSFSGNAIFSAGDATSSIRPYALVGAGYYKTSFTISGSSTGLKAPSSDIGVQGGAGLEFSLSGMSSFLEAKYVSVMRDPNSWTFLPITFGVRF